MLSPGEGIKAYSAIGASKAAAPAARLFALGLLAGFFIAIAGAATNTAAMAKSVSGKAIGAYVPVCLFVLCGFEHCIANMYYIPAGLMCKGVPAYASLAAAAGVELGGLSWPAFLLNNLLPVPLGNILGGMGLALLLWFCHGRAVKTEATGASRL